MSAALDAGTIATLTASLNSELVFILTDAGVHADIQAKIAQTGFEECRLFAKADCGQGEPGIRTYIKEDLLIDPLLAAVDGKESGN